MARKKDFRFPIRFKTILMVVVFGIVLAETAMVYYSIVSSNNNKERYKSLATNLSNTVALALNKNDVKTVTQSVLDIYNDSSRPIREEKEGTQEYKDYLVRFDPIKQTEEYRRLQSSLAGFKAANSDTDGIYLGYVDYDRKLCVYIVYDHDVEAYPVGVIDPLYEEDYPLIENHKLGFVASIYDSPYDGGVLVTAGAPIMDTIGDEPICYALVDITMDTVRAQQANAIIHLFIYLMTSVLLLCVIAIIVVHFTLVKPVKTLSDAAKNYDVSNPEKTHEVFQSLSVNVHDEFADLAISMRKMEDDVYNKMNALIASQKETAKMTELANKDALTGVRNKIAYDDHAERLNTAIANKEPLEFGLAMIDLNYLKEINDKYGHDSGDVALIRLSKLICETFAHSPVYRIGGDEFVIVLQGEDFRHVGSLIARFNKGIAASLGDTSLLPEEQISAAIGYSVFDPTMDTCVDDAFKRADQAMYDRKRKMKGGN